MHLLRVWIPAAGLDDPEPLLSWSAFDAKGHYLGQGEATLADLPDSARTELILPFERVLLTTADLPKQSRRQLQRAVPFALEDRLLSSPEQSHCALGEPAGTQWPIAVVDRAWLNAVVNAFREAFRPVHAAWPAWYWLPPDGCLWLGQEGWQRHGLHHGEYLVEPPADELDVFSGETWEWQRRGPDSHAINVLQGDFAPQARTAGGKSPWRWTAMLAVAVFLVNYGQLIWEVVALKQQVKSLTSELNAGFYKVFPASATAVDPVLQVERKVQEASAGPGAAPSDDFLVMLNKTASFMSRPGTPVGVEYQSGELQIRTQMQASAANAAVSSAQLAGFTADLQPGATPDAPQVIRLRPATQPAPAGGQP